MKTFLGSYSKIQEIVKHKPMIAKTELAREVERKCKISRSEALQWIDKALEYGLIQEIKQRKSGKQGRPPRKYICRPKGRRAEDG
jgi:predicted ArsR family transcriptional regulator